MGHAFLNVVEAPLPPHHALLHEDI